MEAIKTFLINFYIHFDVLSSESWLFNSLLALITIFILLFIFLFVHLSLKRSKNRTKEIIRDQLETYYSDFIVGFLISTKTAKEYTKADFKTPKEKFERVVFMEFLVRLAKGLEGETKAKINDLFLTLKFDNDVKRQLKSKNWEEVSLGLSILSALHTGKNYVGLLKELSNHTRLEIRKSTNKLLIQLFDFEQIKELSNSKNYISEIEQMVIINELSKKQKIEAPDFSTQFKSHNNSFLILLLKICRVYNLKQYQRETQELLSRDSTDLQIQVIENTEYFGYVDNHDKLKTLLKSTSELHLHESIWKYLIKHNLMSSELIGHDYYKTKIVPKTLAIDTHTESEKRFQFTGILVNIVVIISIPLIVLLSEIVYHLEGEKVHHGSSLLFDILYDFGINEEELVTKEEQAITEPLVDQEPSSSLRVADTNLTTTIHFKVIIASFSTEERALTFIKEDQLGDFSLLAPDSTTRNYHVAYSSSYQDLEQCKNNLDSLKDLRNQNDLWIRRIVKGE